MHKNITLGQVARECHISLNKLYDATAKHSGYRDRPDPGLTFDELLRIWHTYLPEKTWEEVTERYDDSADEFDTVSKREARMRKRY